MPSKGGKMPSTSENNDNNDNRSPSPRNRRPRGKARGRTTNVPLHAGGGRCQPAAVTSKEARCFECKKKVSKESPLLDMSGKGLTNFISCHEHFVAERIKVMKDAQVYHVKRRNDQEENKHRNSYTSPSKKAKN